MKRTTPGWRNGSGVAAAIGAALALFAANGATGAEAKAGAETKAPTKAAAGAVKTSEWNGYARVDFEVAGRAGLLVSPKEAAPGRPWIWRTEFFGHEPQGDLALLAKGWHVAYLNASNMYGAPKAIALMEAFHAYLKKEYKLADRVVLEGFSRGGLYAFNYAVAHPTQVAALYLDAPVLDIRSWPGSKPASKEWKECLAVYGLTEQTVGTFNGGPLDNVAVVAKAGVPILSVCGGADSLVPMAQNTSVLEKRYKELGGTIEVIVKPGGEHHPHSLKDPAPIVEFLLKRAKF
ncbi:MAG: prolyl oligopeptidase family serine peptidase [Verrucomicrobia bacterium]|nr:prolyl oligopeptidase family serine peptidase [Verrucomicrobiota bacterium]